MVHLVETNAPRQVLLFFAPVLNPELHSNGRRTDELQMRPRGFTLQQFSPLCKQRLQFCWGSSPAACLQWGSCSPQSPECCTSAAGTFPRCIPALGSHRAGPGSEFSGNVLRSGFVSKAQTLPVAAFSSASLGKQLLLEEGKEEQSSWSHAKIKSSQEILLLKNFRVASS